MIAAVPRAAACALALAYLVSGLAGCGGSGGPAPRKEKVYAPEDMPEICQGIDFNQASADIKEICGVQTRNYMAYKNIPEHRNLLLPKGAKIVRKGKHLELRLQNTLPIALPEEMDGKVLFDERLRRNFIKSRMDYCEFFPEGSSERLRIIRLDIPLDIGGEQSICYTVESRPTTAQRKAGFAGRLEPLECMDFSRLKAIAQGQGGQGSETEAVGTGAGTPVGGSIEREPGR